jgi:circadian clock protein KaiC
MIEGNGTGRIEKLATGIPGFDQISDGGIPKGRTTLVAGTAGSAKTIFAAQFLAEGIRQSEEPGVFVTFEERPHDIRRNLASFGWPIEEWERAELWIFVDASPHPEHELLQAGSYDLGGLLSRVEHAVTRVNAGRVAIDSLAGVFTQFEDGALVRRELFRAASVLRRLGVTAVLTAERIDDYGTIGRFGVEEFIADNVIILRNALEDEKRRRTVEILKFRGTSHQRGEFPFTVISGEALYVFGLSGMELKQRSSNLRITSGNGTLDEMCGGGFFQDSIILVSGATGTGKTLTVTQFLAGGAASGERVLLFAFEESREQLFRNASGWGVDFEKMETEGLLRVVCEYPEVSALEDRLHAIKSVVEDFRPNRLAVDSLSALERSGGTKGFREFVIGLTSYIKHQEVAGLFTSTTPTLFGGQSITEAHISTLTDSIVLLRYVEMYGEMRRGLTVLKMRGSMHDKDIREFTIDATGMHIGSPFRNVTGILTGHPTYVEPSEIERMGSLFSPENRSA